MADRIWSRYLLGAKWLLALCAAMLSLLGVACGRHAPGEGEADVQLSSAQQPLTQSEWKTNTHYAVGAQVIHLGIVYECRQAHRSLTGSEPPKVPALWKRPTPTGIQTWTTQTNYVVGSGVIFNGATYECLQAHVSQVDWTPPATAVLWRCASNSCGGGGCTGLNDGSLCDDGNACTLSDRCKSHKCGGGAAKLCPSASECWATTCNTGTGQCGFTPINAGASCSDGNVCTVNDVCDGAGTCKPGVNATEGAGCSDANPCNGDETCRAGACIAGTPPAGDDGNDCTLDSCDPLTGVTHTPVLANTLCGDGSSCVGKCDALGACLPDQNACVFEPACRSNGLQVRDVEADFREIWQGVEDIETGKRAAPDLTVKVTFNQPVRPSLLVGSAFGLTVGGLSCDGITTPTTAHIVRLRAYGFTDTDEVTFRSEDRLRAGCVYTFQIDRFPANGAGSCLAAPFQVDFRAADGRTAFDREMEVQTFRQKGAIPVSFVSRNTVRTPAARFFSRHAGTFGLRPGLDTLAPVAPAAPDPFGSGTRIRFFQQYFRGVPVASQGYLAREDDAGNLLSATGSVLRGINATVAPAVTAAQAILNYQANLGVPANQRTASGAVAALNLVPVGAGQDHVHLVWRVHSMNGPQGLFTDFDAATGAFLFAQPMAMDAAPAIACDGFLPDQAMLVAHDQLDLPGIPLSQGISLNSQVQVGRWQQGTLWQPLWNREPFSVRTRYAEKVFQPRVIPVINPTPELEITNPIEYLCPAPFSLELGRVTGNVHWWIQAAARTFANWSFAGAPWLGITGRKEDPLLVTTTEEYIVVRDVRGEGPESSSYLPRKPDQIIIRPGQAWGQTIAHEFGHGVYRNSRLRLGTGDSVYMGESGALSEGYGDIMSAVTTRREAESLGVDPWCITLDGVTCLRKLDAPKMAPFPTPDTYELITNPLVSVHFQATIAGHWFYTLVKGRPAGKANDNGCFVAVEPLDSDAQKAIDAAALLVFRSFPALQPADGFQKAREMTTMMASTTLSAAGRRTVEAAWHAVGVGGAPKPNSISPKEGATDVNPWDVNFTWEVGGQPGPWTLRWATNNEFKDAKIVNVTGVRADNGVRSATADIALPPGKTIYWQAVEGSGNVNWECGAFWSHFSTAPQDIKVVEPATIGQDGFYQTNPRGAVLWGRTPGADKFEARLSLTSDDCDENKAWTEVPHPPPFTLEELDEVYLGDTIAENLVLIRNPVKLFPPGELDLDQNTTYHLYIRAVHGDHRGQCGHFPVRKAMLKPFNMIGSLDPDTLPFKSGGPFAWQPSQGAGRYEIVLVKFGGPPGNLDEVAFETVDAAMLQPNADGNLEYTLANKDALSIPSELFWEVTSIHPLGFRRSANLTGVPPTALIQTPSFFTAAEAKFDATFDGGQVAPAVAGRIPVKIVRPRNMQDKVTKACFAKPANTLGMRYWWGGTSDFPITADKVVKVLPDPTTPDKLCTADLPLRDDTMFLLSQFFSNGVQQGPGGPLDFNPVGLTRSQFFDVSLSQCGGVGDACCDPTTCTDGAICNSARKCVACGGPNQPCCKDNACQPSMNLICNANSQCVMCGDTGQVCCPSGSNCRGSNVCSSNTCLRCGGVNQPCCNGACTGSGLQCKAGQCRADMPCNSTIHAGTTAPETHVIQLGKTSGVVRFLFKSFEIPDAFTLRYQGIDLIPRLCTNTKTNDTTFIPAACNRFTGFCCDGVDQCWKDVPYSGSESSMTVIIEPNCAIPDSNTRWEFVITCPQ